jgi:two-component system, OmpR family, manganese sensing response regulator
MKVLLAEDEKEMQYALVTILKHYDYEVDSAYDGEEALKYARAGSYDCLILDIMMPKMSGLEVLKQIRAAGDVTPVIMLTAKAELDDRVEGLDAGADDYLTKPFAVKELLARVRSLTRRNESYTPKTLQFANLTLHMGQQELTAHNSIRLASKEAKLMEYFLLNPGKRLATEDIYQHIWADEEDVEEEIVWIYISYLRSKLLSVDANVVIEGEAGGSFCLMEK